MPAPAPVDKSKDNGETLRYLTEIQGTQGNLFMTKVHRGPLTSGGYPHHLGTFDGVTLGHLSNAELWLPFFAGGGLYQLDVYHDKDKVNPVGRLTYHVDGVPLDVDPNIIKTPDWAGPPILLLPAVRDPQPPTEHTIFPSGSSRGSPASYRSGAPQRDNVAPDGQSPGNSFFTPQIAGMVGLLENKLHRVDEAERRRELDAIRAETQRNLEGYQREIRELQHKLATPPPAPQKGGTDTIAAIAAVVGPLVLEMIKSGNQARLEALRVQQQQAQYTQKMISVMLHRPQTDPTVEKLLDKMERMIERSQESRGDAYEGAAKIAEANTRMLTGSIRAMEAVTTILKDDGKDDHPAMLIFREGLEA